MSGDIVAEARAWREALTAERERCVTRIAEIDGVLGGIGGKRRLCPRDPSVPFGAKVARVRARLAQGPCTYRDLEQASDREMAPGALRLMELRGEITVDRTIKPHVYALAVRP